MARSKFDIAPQEKPTIVADPLTRFFEPRQPGAAGGDFISLADKATYGVPNAEAFEVQKNLVSGRNPFSYYLMRYAKRTRGWKP